METRTFDMELRAKGRRIEGVIPYGKLSEDLGGFREIISRGAFHETLKSGARVVALYSHNSEKPIGSTEAGTLSLKDEADGLHFSIQPPNNSWGQDVLESVSRGDIRGCSFGFQCEQDSWENRDGFDIRHVEKAKLIEISPVVFPAYPDTKVNIRKKGSTYMKRTLTENELREEMGYLADKAELLIESARTERRQLSSDENNEFVELTNTHDKYAGQLEAQGFDVAYFRESGMDGVNEWRRASQRRPIKPDFQEGTGDFRDERRATGDMALFQRYLGAGRSALSGQELRELEQRALALDADVQGGFVVAPEEFTNRVIQALDNRLWIRQFATVIKAKKSASLGVPVLDSDPGDETLDWTAELKTGAEDSTMDFQKRQLTPHPLARRLKISKTLVNRSQINVVDFATNRLAYVFGTVLEYNYLRGTGSSKPMGVFEPSDLGIGTDRDVSTGNTTTAIKADGLMECESLLKEPYRAGARWIFSRTALKQIRTLKDGTGNYLWIQGLNGSPSTILSYPFHVSEYCPSTFTASQYVGILGDFSFYWICDSLDFQVQVLTELYAESNQLGVIARYEGDGMPVLSEAFVRVQLGS